MRAEKQFLLDEVIDQLDQYKSFLIMRYSGLTANTAHEFRREVANTGGNVEILRKRLLIKAAKKAGVELTLEQLQGHIGLIFAGPDALHTTKTAIRYSKEAGNVIEVIGGNIDGQMYTAEQVEMLSTLPSKDEMRAQLLSVFEAPMSQTLAVMDSMLTSVLFCMDNHAKGEGKE
jgi:large subunit ribosomal protein L10